MSISQLNNDISRLNKDILTIQDKLAREKKVESDKKARIATIQKSINKNTSASTYSSKIKECQRLQDDANKSVKKQADLQKDLAKKQKTLSEKNISLGKEQEKERKKEQAKQQAQQKALEQNYNKRVQALQNSLTKATEVWGRHHKNDVPSHIYKPNDDVKYDVFVSHASEDKETFVDEFVKELEKLDISVWYDKQCIIWGDSLRAKIDEGLRNSRYGIAVLSKDYIRKGWTQYELEGLFNIEMNKGKTILPIWHNITKAEVQDFSPTIAGRMAMSTALMTPAEIAKEFLSLIKSE